VFTFSAGVNACLYIFIRGETRLFVLFFGVLEHCLPQAAERNAERFPETGLGNIYFIHDDTLFGYPVEKNEKSIWRPMNEIFDN